MSKILSYLVHIFKTALSYSLMILLLGLTACHKDVPAYKKRQQKLVRKMKQGKPLPCPCDHK